MQFDQLQRVELLYDRRALFVFNDRLGIAHTMGETTPSTVDTVWELGAVPVSLEAMTRLCLIEKCETEERSSLIFALGAMSGNAPVTVLVVVQYGNRHATVSAHRLHLLNPGMGPPGDLTGRRFVIPYRFLYNPEDDPEDEAGEDYDFLTATLVGGNLLARLRGSPDEDGEGHVVAWDCTSGMLLTEEGILYRI